MENPAPRSRALKRILSNAVSILSSNILIKATTFILYALVARHSGAREFGQLSLALSLLYTFHIFAVAGLKTLTVREVAKDHSLAFAYLNNASILVIGASIVSFAGLLGLIRLMDYSESTQTIIFALFIGLLPYALSQICEAVFQAWEKMHFIAYANGPMHIGKAVAAYLLLTNSFDVIYVAYAVAAAYWGILLIEWFILWRMEVPSSNLSTPQRRVDFGFMIDIARRGAAFLGIEGVFAINASIGIIILARLLSETEVGIYSSALQVIMPLSVIINNVVHSVFPIMCRKFEQGSENLGWVVERLIEVLIVLILPAVVGITLFADEVLLLLYQNSELSAAAYLLQILVWGALVNAFITVLGQVLWASKREKQSLVIAITTTSINLIGNLIFIQFFGLNGVVITAFCISIVTLIQHYLPVSKLLEEMRILPVVWKPIIATICMALVLTQINAASLFSSIGIGALAYLLIIAALYVWSFGGVGEARVKVRQLGLGSNAS